MSALEQLKSKIAAHRLEYTFSDDALALFLRITQDNVADAALMAVGYAAGKRAQAKR